jgi:hypothetical protein
MGNMWKRHIKLPGKFVFDNRHLNVAVRVVARLSKIRNKIINIDFSKIRQIRKGDLMVLIAQIERLFEKGKTVKITGDVPLIVSQMWPKKVLHFNERSLEKYKAYKARRIFPLKVVNLVRKLSKLGIDKNSPQGTTFYERIEAFIMEMIDNAVEHGIRENNINYWLISEIDENSEQMRMTFVDMGRGIARSHRKSGMPWKYNFSTDSRIVLDSLHGKLQSSTKNPNRGKGLPTIRDIVKKQLISNFILITNRTAIKYDDEKFIPQRVANFKGTCYIWTINKQNFEIWKNIPSTSL